MRILRVEIWIEKDSLPGVLGTRGATAREIGAGYINRIVNIYRKRCRPNGNGVKSWQAGGLKTCVRHSRHNGVISSDTVSWSRIGERHSQLLQRRQATESARLLPSDRVSRSCEGGATKSAPPEETSDVVSSSPSPATQSARKGGATESAPPEETSDVVSSSPSPATQSAGVAKEERHSQLLRSDPPSPTAKLVEGWEREDLL